MRRTMLQFRCIEIRLDIGHLNVNLRTRRNLWANDEHISRRNETDFRLIRCLTQIWCAVKRSTSLDSIPSTVNCLFIGLVVSRVQMQTYALFCNGFCHQALNLRWWRALDFLSQKIIRTDAKRISNRTMENGLHSNANRHVEYKQLSSEHDEKRTDFVFRRTNM